MTKNKQYFFYRNKTNNTKKPVQVSTFDNFYLFIYKNKTKMIQQNKWFNKITCSSKYIWQFLKFIYKNKTKNYSIEQKILQNNRFK